VKFYVYALIDPRDESIRYVGKSSNPARRLATHMSRAAAPAMRSWIALIGRPTVRILEELADETAALLAEQAWITEIGATYALLNVAHDADAAAVESLEETSFHGFGSRCVVRRKSLGLTQRELARRACVSQPALSAAECCETTRLGTDAAVRIARALGCSVEWLVTGEEREVRRVA